MESNEVLLTIRHNLISIFKKYEYILLPIIRFIISFSVLHMLKEVTGYTGILGSIIATSALSLIGAFASAQLIEVCSIFLVVFFLLPSNPIMAVMMFILLAMIYILYGRLCPKESMLIIGMIVAFSIKMEVAVPIIAALFGSYVSIIAIIIGTMMWFIIPELRVFIPSTGINQAELLDTLPELLSIDFKALLTNQTMMIMLVVFFIVFTCIYLIRKLSIDYGPYIAIIIGAVMNILGFGLATIFFLETDINLVRIVIETVSFSLIAAVMQFLSIALDYQRAENVSFEDDDNYYYVKIVPKIKLSSKQKKEKTVYTDLPHASYNDHKVKNDDFNNSL